MIVITISPHGNCASTVVLVYLNRFERLEAKLGLVFDRFILSLLGKPMQSPIAGNIIGLRPLQWRQTLNGLRTVLVL